MRPSGRGVSSFWRASPEAAVPGCSATAKIQGDEQPVAIETGQNPHFHRAAGRVAGRALRGNRVVNASIVAGGKVLGSLGRVFHQLFLETMGLFFLLFAATSGFATYRQYQSYVKTEAGFERVVLGLFVTGLFSYFAASSFWRARRRAQ